MNKIFPLVFMGALGLACAQYSPSIATPAPREHRGFYSNASFGAGYSWYSSSMEEYDETSYDDKKVRDRTINYFDFSGGTFPIFEFKFGVAAANLLTFHTVFNFGFFMGTMEEEYRSYRRECDQNGECEEYLKKNSYHEPFLRDKAEVVTSDAYSFRTYIGFGSTVYPIQDKQSVMNGFFVGGSVGYTFFATFIDGGLEDECTNTGLSYQFELGKDWWVNDHLSIGVGLGYARTGLVLQTVKSHDSENVISLSFRLTRG